MRKRLLINFKSVFYSISQENKIASSSFLAFLLTELLKGPSTFCVGGSFFLASARIFIANNSPQLFHGFYNHRILLQFLGTH